MTISASISIFRASNFLEYMWPSFALSQGFGLFPYKISRNILSSSIPGYVYAGSILTLLTLAVITLAYNIQFNSDMNYDSVPAILQSDCYLFLGYLFCLASFLRSEKKLLLYKKIAGISYQIDKSEWNKSAIFIHAKDILGFLFLIGQMPNAFKGSYLDVFFKLICAYITLVIYLLDDQFLNCVLATKLLFRSVNSELKRFEDQSIAKEFHENLITSDRRSRDGKNMNLMREIRSLRKNYEDICAIVKNTNDTFSLPIMISLGLTFAEVTFSLYFYILKSVGAKEMNLEKQFWYFYFITSATYYSSKFLIAVWTCETTEDEAQKSKTIVHRILTKLYDEEVTRELQSFSLQMVQRNISYSAHGISLDGSLVTRVAGGISTYFLILIQFLITSKQCG